MNNAGLCHFKFILIIWSVCGPSSVGCLPSLKVHLSALNTPEHASREH